LLRTEEAALGEAAGEPERALRGTLDERFIEAFVSW
jgi:hypothetical protein